MSSKANSTPLKLYLLGSFQIETVKGPLNVPARKAQSLIAYLVLYPGEHAREKLAALFWGDSPDGQARDSFRTALTTVRKHLGDQLLLADRETVELNPAFPLWVDVREFEQQVATAPQSALALYGGDLLVDVYEDWLLPERERLREIYVDTLLRQAEDARARGEYVESIELAKKVLSFDAANEQAYLLLMFCHYARGDRTAALKQYEACARVLRAELDITPSAETTALYEEIKRAGMQAPPPETRRSNVPIPLTSFIGREKECGEIKAILARTRLVTLVGAGGSGKTRLAIQVASDIAKETVPNPHFANGVWWVELAALAEASLAPAAVAKVLGDPQVLSQPTAETLVNYLESKNLLLVLDNCEHLIHACAELAEALLRACPHLKILATSREVFGLTGESAYSVPTLSLPKNLREPLPQILEHEATRLFVERAFAVKPNFAIKERDAIAITQICERLDGIPLAIELAAARVKVLSPEEIVAGLDDRFGLLTSGSRTALPRHQTLRATLDWSYNLLTEPERVLFWRLSVFAGGFTLDLAREICTGAQVEKTQILDLLSHLVDKSLVIADAPSQEMEGTRYRLLETLREYAGEKLREAEQEITFRNRHLEFFVSWVEQLEPELEHAEQQVWLDRLELEIANLRAAIDWAQESGDISAALRLVGGLERFWFVRLHFNEGVERVRGILAHPDAIKAPAARLRALNGLFNMLCNSAQIEARSLFDEAVAEATRLGDHRNKALALLWMGVNEINQGDYPRARSVLEQSLELWRELHDPKYMAWAFAMLGEVTIFENDFVRAQALYQASIPPLREAGDSSVLAIPLRRLGQLALFDGHLGKAESLINESLRNNLMSRDSRGTGACLAALGALSMAQAQHTRAATFFGATDGILELIHSPFLLFDQQQYEDNVKRLRTQLDEASFTTAWDAGRGMPLEQTLEFIREPLQDVKM